MGAIKKLARSIMIAPRKKEYEDRWLVLTGVSEYLRLFGKSEADSQYFSKYESKIYRDTLAIFQDLNSLCHYQQ